MIDGHVAGIVTSFLQGREVDKRLISVDKDFNIKLDSIKTVNPNQKGEWLVLRNYKDKLDELLRLVLALYDKA